MEDVASIFCSEGTRDGRYTPACSVPRSSEWKIRAVTGLVLQSLDRALHSAVT